MDPRKSHPIDTLRRLPLFTDLSDDEIALIANSVNRMRFDQGAVVFCEGDPCNELLIVEEGAVRIFKSAASGRRQLIGIERPGNSLGEVAIFDGGCYPTSAETAIPTVLLQLPAAKFRKICLQNPELSLKVFRVLGHRLRHLVSLIEELSFSTVRGRLIAFLIRLAEETGQRTASGLQFELTENNEELAARLGTVRELVSRNLGRLHGAGLIKMNRRVVCIPDIVVLRNEVMNE
jgi:CRP-like cAMP-binding protein